MSALPASTPAFAPRLEILELKRLYEEGMSIRNLAKEYHVCHNWLSRELQAAGIKIRPRKSTTCQCGKPVARQGKCKFHWRLQSAQNCAKYRRTPVIGAMCEHLTKIAISRRDDLIGVVAYPRISKHGRIVSYFWQGAEDRSPAWKRRLGTVPDRVAMRASRMLLKSLQKARSA